MRHCFAKNGGSLGVTGSVSFMFDKKGVLVIERTPDSDEDEMMMTVLDAGAEDMQTMDDAFEVTTDPNEFSAVREKLEAAGTDLPERRGADDPAEYRGPRGRRNVAEGAKSCWRCWRTTTMCKMSGTTPSCPKSRMRSKTGSTQPKSTARDS